MQDRAGAFSGAGILNSFHVKIFGKFRGLHLLSWLSHTNWFGHLMADNVTSMDFCSSSVVKNWCSAAADRYTEVVRDCTRPKARNTMIPALQTPFIALWPPPESLAICLSLCNPLWEIRNCVRLTLYSSHHWSLNSHFPKKLSVFQAVTWCNDQSCGHALTCAGNFHVSDSVLLS